MGILKILSTMLRYANYESIEFENFKDLITVKSVIYDFLFCSIG